MKSIFVVFTCLILLNCASRQTVAQTPAPAPQTTAPQAPASSDGPDKQTLRVINDKLTWQLMKPFEKKYKVACTFTLSTEASNKNPHWTCLNNSACSYAMTIVCLDKKTKKPALSVEVDGFDDTKNTQVQNLTVTYLNN